MGNTRSLIMQRWWRLETKYFMHFHSKIPGPRKRVCSDYRNYSSWWLRVRHTERQATFKARTGHLYFLWPFFHIFHIKPSSSKAASWIEKKTFWSGLESYSRIFWIQCLYFLPNLDLKICFPNFTTHAKSISELVKLKTSQIWIGMLKTQS